MRILIAVPTVTGRADSLARTLDAYRQTSPVLAELHVGRDAPPPRITGNRWHREAADVAAIFVYHDRATCGEVWNAAALDAQAIGADAIHFTADDLEPQRNLAMESWWDEALVALDSPAPWSPVYPIRSMPMGVAESHGETWGSWRQQGVAASMTRIPTMLLEWWRPIPPIHYWSDNAVSSVLLASGVPMRTASAPFGHWWAQEGRQSGAGPVATAEREAYEAFVAAGCEVGA